MIVMLTVALSAMGADLNCNGIASDRELGECGGVSSDAFVMFDVFDCRYPVSNLDVDLDGFGSGAVRLDEGGRWIVRLDCDNCPFVSNPDQLDSNGDGIGDACPTRENCDHDGIPMDEDPLATDALRGPGCRCVNTASAGVIEGLFVFLWWWLMGPIRRR